MPYLQERLYSFLRWSEKYTKTDMLYLATGGFWSTAAQVIISASSFILAIVVSHFLPKEAYGNYKYVLSAVALLSTFSLTLSTPVFQSTARGFEGALRQGFWDNLRWSIVIFGGALVLAVYYLTLHNTTLAIGILIGGCLSPFISSANLGSSYLAGKKDFARQAIYFGVGISLLSAGALILTILITSSSLALVCVYFIVNALATLFFYWKILHTDKPDQTKSDPEMLSYGKHLSVMSLLNGVAGNLDQILVFHYIGAVELAIYNFATAIPDQTKGPLKTLDTMVQAKFATQKTGSIRGGMNNKVWLLTIFSVVFVGLYIALAPFIYRVFFPAYVDAVFYSQIYALSLLGLGLVPAGSYLTAKKKIKEQYALNIGVSVFQIVVMFGGIILWGLLGMMIARVVVRLGGGLFTYALYKFAPNTAEA